MLIPPDAEQYDDGLLYQERGPHAHAQTMMVHHYLDAVSHELARMPARRRTFVQLFAEAGMYRHRETREWFVGAALHALSLPGFNQYIYTTLNPQVLTALEHRYHTFFPDRNADVHFMGGNCNDLARGIVSETEFYLSSRRATAPLNLPPALTVCLCQNDIYLRWETLEALSRLPDVNLILYYPVDALNRQMPLTFDQPGTTAVDTFFGESRWRDVYRRGVGHNRHDLLIPYYCKRLQELGFSEVVPEWDLHPSPTAEQGESGGHCLIFAHKQPKTAAFWQAVAG